MPVDSEQLLYLLYTSGTTAKPKGIMHTTGGYLTQVGLDRTRYVFDLKAESDVYWCAADVGWVTGHSYIVYGPLANGATSVMYEGTPDTPREERRGGRPGDVAQGPHLGHHRALRSDPALHRTHGDPDLHEVGRRRGRGPRPVVAAGARHRRRADQPRGVDVVPHQHRWRTVPDRRHLVADRDRRAHDLAAARHHRDEARIRVPRPARASPSSSSTTRASPSSGAAAT